MRVGIDLFHYIASKQPNYNDLAQCILGPSSHEPYHYESKIPK